METKVESFVLDHTKVKAPYVRKCCLLDGEKGDKVTKFDLRFLWGDVEPSYVKNGLEKALEMVLESDEMPAATEEECGNYRDLSLEGAKKYTKYVLEKGFSLNIYGDK